MRGDMLSSQFLRIGRAQDYEKHHHNGHSDSDETDDPKPVPEIAAHQNVFQRP